MVEDPITSWNSESGRLNKRRNGLKYAVILVRLHSIKTHRYVFLVLMPFPSPVIAGIYILAGIYIPKFRIPCRALIMVRGQFFLVLQIITQ
jgi:hypothetical protein